MDLNRETFLEEIKNVINLYVNKYFDINDDKETWFNKIKELSTECGYTTDMKAYKENPDNFKGSVADVSNMIRVSLTSKTTTPDLYEIINLLGKDRTISRLNKIVNM